MCFYLPTARSCDDSPPVDAAEAAEEAAAEPGAADPQLVELLVKNEIARRVTQMYVLERLSRLDIATARDMLASLVPALERLSKVCCSRVRLYCTTWSVLRWCTKTDDAVLLPA